MEQPADHISDEKLSRIVRYFKDCYNADNREQAIPNFFASKTIQLVHFEGEDDLLCGHLPYVPLAPEKGDTIARILQLHSKEKELVLGAFFITGPPVVLNNRETKICAPLFFYPAEIVETFENHFRNFFVKVNFDKRKINLPVLKAILKQTEGNSELSERISAELPDGKLDFDKITRITHVLKRHIPKLDVEPLLYYPKLEPNKKIRSYMRAADKKNAKKYTLYSAYSAGIMDISVSGRGILSDLNILEDAEKLSPPVRQILSGSIKNTSKEVEDFGITPAILSAAQQHAVENASKYDVSMLIGPPGTGKSFTIAALAVEQISRNKTVLIVSRNDEAVDVVKRKIEKQLKIKKVCIRAGKAEHRNQFREFQNLTYFTTTFGRSDVPHDKEVKYLETELQNTRKEIERLEDQFRNLVEVEMEWGAFVATKVRNSFVVKKLKDKFLNFKNNSVILWKIIQRLAMLDKHKNAVIKDIVEAHHLRRTKALLEQDRKTLVNYSHYLKSRPGASRENYFKKINFDSLLKAFPAWLITLSDLNKALPLYREMFDLVIIDEATQCDIASCLPALQRAKSAMICGDPQQLRHVSFLSRMRMSALQAKHDLQDIPMTTLDFRSQSILDRVNDSFESHHQVTFLDEHFRSHPAIINFSNFEIYNESLQIMTKRPLTKRELSNRKREQRSLQFEFIERGVRDKKGHNEVEAMRVVEAIQAIMTEQALLPTSKAHSIGVISPFRAQVNLLSKMIHKSTELGQMEKHDLLVGTPFSFQGEERDIILLSLSVDSSTTSTAIYYMQKTDVFNVAITRARSRQVVFHSILPDKLPIDSLLRKYVETSLRFYTEEEEELADDVEDNFAQEVQDALEAKELAVWPAYPFAGMVVDMMILHNGNYVGIDLIGFPGEFEDAFPIERYRILSRAGIETYPLPYTYWKFDPESCLKELLELIEYEH